MAACPGVRVGLRLGGGFAGVGGSAFGELSGFAADPFEEGVVESVEGGLVTVVFQAFGVEFETEGGGEFVEVDAWPALAGEFVRDSLVCFGRRPCVDELAFPAFGFGLVRGRALSHDDRSERVLVLVLVKGHA